MLNAKYFESFDWNVLKEGKVEEFLVGQEFSHRQKLVIFNGIY